MVIVICGPIASGKSTLARAVARRFRDQGVDAAAIDLDLVYEMLDEKGTAKASPATWRRARIAAAAMTDALLEDGVGVVVVEGDFLTPQERAEFGSALRSSTMPSFVTLRSPIEVALHRVAADPTRGLSRDPVVLRRHYQDVEPAMRDRPAADLVIDTSSITVEEASGMIKAWATARADTTAAQ